jgi:hypothetical protein
MVRACVVSAGELLPLPLWQKEQEQFWWAVVFGPTFQQVKMGMVRVVARDLEI